MQRTGRIGVMMVLACCTLSVAAAPVGVAGGTAANPTDITDYLLTNQDIALTGGNYIVRVPQSGSRIVAANSVDATLSAIGNNGFSVVGNPAINYTGVISGNGVVRVTSAFNGQAPAYGQLFTGGALLFTGTGAQTWGVEGVASGGHNAAALIVDPNVTVGFLDASRSSSTAASAVLPTATDKSRNIVNNGYIYASRSNLWASITGTGVTVFQYNGGLGQLRGPQGSVYSGQLFDFNSGTRTDWGSAGPVFENRPDGQPTVLESSDITLFISHNYQWLTDPATYKIGDPILTVNPNIYMSALNHQLGGSGIIQFNGTLLPPVGSRNHLDLAPVADAMQGLYYYGSGSNQGFGRIINLSNRMTLLMGDGREVVTNPDGVTNNTYFQGSPFNTLTSTSNFEYASSGLYGEAMAYNYSGQYRVNVNMNASVNSNGGVIAGLRNDDWVNLLFLDPTVWNPRATQPNHAVVTVPVFFAGLTRIDRNAVLQLGDGTIGNDVASKTLTVNGQTITSRYNDSMGNGMLMTKGNEAMVPKGTTRDGVSRESMNAKVTFEIVNNGKLIINNTPSARDATTAGASAEIAAWVTANQLDGIKGSGSVEQRGTLPLTLGAASGNDNSYTGGTIIAKGATLIAGSASALGTRDAAVGGTSGNVVNSGTLRAAAGMRTINVPGDYTQATATAAATGNMSASTDQSGNGGLLRFLPFIGAIAMRRGSRATRAGEAS